VGAAAGSSVRAAPLDSSSSQLNTTVPSPIVGEHGRAETNPDPSSCSQAAASRAAAAAAAAACCFPARAQALPVIGRLPATGTGATGSGSRARCGSAAWASAREGMKVLGASSSGPGML